MPRMVDSVQATLVTTTSYGSWLPGDARGYVERGEILPPAPALLAHAKSRMRTTRVTFEELEQDALFGSLVRASAEFRYRLSDAVVEATHLHWIIGHDDPIEEMVGRLKNRMRQALGRGRIWTVGYCGRPLATLRQLDAAREYLARHAGARMIAGQIVERPRQ